LGAGLFQADAQSRRYNGPKVDVERMHDEPAPYNECSRLHQKNSRDEFACNFGADEGRRMAMKYGGGYGHMHGFLRGFSWGLFSTAHKIENDPRVIAEGARSVNGMGSHMNSGIQLGQQQGQAQGSAAGSNLAIERFNSAVDTGKFPSSQFNMPQISYAGEDNGYVRFVEKNGAKSPSQILQEMSDRLNSHVRAYDSLDPVFVGDVPRLLVGDVWRDDGNYHFEKRQWLDADSALKLWLDRPIDTKPKYYELKKPRMAEPRSDENKNKTGQLAETENLRSRAVDLQQIFRSAFLDSYRHYALYFFSREFDRALDDGQMQGELAGIELGQRLAFQKGMIAAFDEQFKESSRNAFRFAYEDAFVNSFNAAFEDYANNPKLEIDFNSVIGAEDDGIIQPGEAVAVSFRVKNSGGRAAPVRVSLGGDIVEPRSVALEDMPPLATRNFNTSAIAVVNPQLRTGVDAKLILNVNGREVPRAERIMTPIQIAKYRRQVDAMQGLAQAFIAVQNITTRRSAGAINVELVLPGKSITQELGSMEAGQIKEAELSIAGLDPLPLIKGIDAGIQVAMGNRFMSDGKIKLLPEDPKLALAGYFDQIIKGQGLVPANIALGDRITEVKKVILEKNLADVSDEIDGNPWKDNKLSTMLGLLVNNLKSIDQTSSTKKAYSQLGQDLWEHRKKLGKILFIKSGRRKEYESLCKELM
jgi:flagellar biosynthesis/type III secretory pathway protein FliH